MPENKFRIVERFKNFWTRLASQEIKRKETLIYCLGWLASSLLVFLTTDGLFGLILLVTFVFFWFKLVGELHKALGPPNELLIFLFILFWSLQSALLASVHSISAFSSSEAPDPGWALGLLQSLILSILILFFSLVLVQNSKGKRNVLVGYALLAIVGTSLLSNSSLFYLIIVQVALFILLLRKTTWLEELTKIECWLYLVVVFFVFRSVSDFYFFGQIKSSDLGLSSLWSQWPHFLYLLIKMYLLALLVKIPVVLVYNFARLSRKLKISSLFQSTFPQIIQLIMLLIIFYCFLAGWQAEKVRRAVVSQTEQMISGRTRESLEVFRFPVGSPDSKIHLSGYEPVNQTEQFPNRGVLRLVQAQTADASDSNGRDYFLFSRSSEEAGEAIYFVKIDSSFLEVVSRNSSILAGSSLLAYPFNPPPWESYIYDLALWDEDQGFTIFPFELTPQEPKDTRSAPFLQDEKGNPKWVEGVNFQTSFDNQLTIGRMIAPILNANIDQIGFFAFDILLIPDLSFFTLTLASYLLLLVLIYGLVNFVIIRRMVEFGSEINHMIVQKFNQLRSGIREISAGNLDYKVKLEGEDEFVELAARFNQMGSRLKDSIAEAREKERLKHELTIARKVQLDLLPRDLPEIPGFQVAATLKTANEVGGDFYDVVRLDDNRYLFTIGDVSGKSTSAAFYMAQCISLIRYSRQFTNEPREIGLHLNRYFSDPLVDRQIFVTAVLGLLDTKLSSLRLVRAGHPLPILLPGNVTEEMRELKLDGLGIGLERVGEVFEKHLEDGLIPLQPDDIVVFYTDGVVEASHANSRGADEENSAKEFYGEERFMKLLAQLRGKDAAEILKAVTNDLDSFYEGQSPVDDYTLLIIRKAGSSP